MSGPLENEPFRIRTGSVTRSLQAHPGFVGKGSLVLWQTVLPASCCGSAPVGVALQAAKEKCVILMPKEGTHLYFRPKSATTEHRTLLSSTSWPLI